MDIEKTENAEDMNGKSPGSIGEIEESRDPTKNSLPFSRQMLLFAWLPILALYLLFWMILERVVGGMWGLLVSWKRDTADFYKETKGGLKTLALRIDQAGNCVFGTIWFVMLATVFAIKSGDANALTMVVLIYLALFFRGDELVRTIVSLVAIPVIMGTTAKVAWTTGVLQDPHFWLFSKVMFIAFFGVFGTHLAELINWKKHSSLAIVVAGFSVFIVYFLKFGSHSESSEMIWIAGEMYNPVCFPIVEETPKVFYGPHDWFEDVLLGTAVILYAVIVPKVVKKQHAHPQKT